MWNMTGPYRMPRSGYERTARRNRRVNARNVPMRSGTRVPVIFENVQWNSAELRRVTNDSGSPFFVV